MGLSLLYTASPTADTASLFPCIFLSTEALMPWLLLYFLSQVQVCEGAQKVEGRARERMEKWMKGRGIDGDVCERREEEMEQEIEDKMSGEMVEGWRDRWKKRWMEG